MQDAPHTPAIPAPLFVLCLLYGGMTVIAGVLGFKQVALGPLAVEAGIFAFLMLVVISSTVAQVYGRRMADRIVLFGFLPLAVSIGLIFLVLQLPPSAEMPPENVAAFRQVLSSTPRIMAAGPVAYGVSLLLGQALAKVVLSVVLVPPLIALFVRAARSRWLAG